MNNISAFNANASSGLNRPQVPRNNSSVSFKGAAGSTVEQAAQAVVKKSFKKKAGDFFKGAGAGIQNAWKSGKDAALKFIAEHKGVKGVKLAALGLTVLLAGGFAVKEIHDIVTKSNPER